MTAASEKSFIVTRTCNAPRERVWRAWTERDALAQWWGPKGCGLEVVALDVRPGGFFHYSMAMPDGSKWWGRFAYREIVKPERIVFTNSFSDPQSGVTRAPFSADWPLEILNVLTLTEDGNKTALRLEGRPVDPTDAERAMFESMFDSLNQGFGGTFEQLDAYLAKS